MKKLFTFIAIITLFASCSDEKNNAIFLVGAPNQEFIAFGQTVEYDMILRDYTLAIDKPEGWTVTSTGSSVKITAPAKTDETAKTSGTVKLTAGGYTFNIAVNTGIVVGFEDVPAKWLAVDEYGSNFYTDTEYEGEQYLGYTDSESGLRFRIEDLYEPASFASGGTVFSTFNSTELTTDYRQQCRVYYKDEKTGKGGHKGSSVFAVSYTDTSIAFEENKEYVLDHFYVCNTAYTAGVILESNSLAGSLNYNNKGYITVVFTGYNANGTQTGTVKYYLADYRTADSPGLMEGWNWVDLSPLGKVNKVGFSYDASDVNEEWGYINTPTYFCFDDIAIRY